MINKLISIMTISTTFWIKYIVGVTTIVGALPMIAGTQAFAASTGPGPEFQPSEVHFMPPTPASLTANTGTVLDRSNQARTTNLAANVSTRMENTINRLEQISIRIESRRILIAQTGIDTSEASAQLNTAASALNSARTRLATIDTDVARTVSTPGIRENWQVLRSTYQASGADVAIAYQALVGAVTALKNPAAPLSPPVASSSISTE